MEKNKKRKTVSMVDRKSKFSKIEKLIIYYLPYLRYLKHRRLHEKIKRNWKSYYGRKVLQSLNACLKFSPPFKVKERPNGYFIEITNACNLRCPMCGTHLAKRKKMHMDLKIYKRLLERIKDEGINVVSLYTVGEPLVYPYLEEAISIAKSMGIETLISTNANLPNKLKSIYQRNSHWVNGFRFSVDSGIPETYARIRMGGELEKVIESCEWLLKTNKGKHMSRIALTIDCVISKENIREIATFFRLFSKYTFPEHIRFGIINGLTPDTTYFNQKKLFFPNLYRLNIPCHRVFEAIYFNNEGKATLCCRDYDNQLVIGDALKQPISQIWQSETAQQIRRQHLGEEKLTVSQCKRCYTPQAGVSVAVNNFIHFLYYALPEFDDKEWNKKILNFLEDLDLLLAKPESFNITTILKNHLR